MNQKKDESKEKGLKLDTFELYVEAMIKGAIIPKQDSYTPKELLEEYKQYRESIKQ